MSKPVDIAGQRYGRLVAQRRIGHAHNNSIWELVCDCGNFTQVLKGNLKRTFSCGCYGSEFSKTVRLKHGEALFRNCTKLYRKWQKMKERCYNKNSQRYAQYGGRGIQVCEEWKNNSGAFLEWAHANGYQEGLEIDRIDVNGHYEPSNCRFVTKAENAGNKQRSRKKKEGGF